MAVYWVRTNGHRLLTLQGYHQKSTIQARPGHDLVHADGWRRHDWRRVHISEFVGMSALFDLQVWIGLIAHFKTFSYVREHERQQDGATVRNFGS